MTGSRFVLALALLACLALPLSLYAGDPRVIINDPPFACPVVTGLSFDFFSDASGGGSLCFMNMSGVTWTQLDVNVPAPMPIDVITCGGIAFSSCLVLPPEDGAYATIEFFGGPGIGNTVAFTVDLGATGWTPNAEFNAYANQPEPTTLVLLATGAVAAAMRRRRQ